MTEAPRIIGRYALYAKIASGGMATVHLGRLLGPVGFSRTVAIKKMHPHFTEDPEFVSMFLDEARLAARIRHPNVVPTLDVVATEGELFLVMDYVQGETLARLMRLTTAQKKMTPLPIAGAIFSGVLHGLHAAHEAKNERGEPLGIVHRDVSPQNIMVGVDGVSRVLDFGVAKAAGRLQTTRDGQLKGKISYMAPEQVRGHPATRQTDIYAVAVVLWETLAGKRLFQDDNDAAVLQRVLDGQVTPPSAHVPELPPAFDALVLRGLERDPARRFRTAREMAAAIEAVLPLAIPVQVGEWVETTAGPNLASQAARVAEIESASGASVFATPESTRTAESPAPPLRSVAGFPPTPRADPPQAASPAATPPVEFLSEETLVAEHPPVPDPTVDPSVRSQMSSISVSTPGPPGEVPDRRRSIRWIVGSVVGACALILVTALIVRPSQPAAPSEVGAASQPVSAPVASATATAPPFVPTAAAEVPSSPPSALAAAPPRPSAAPPSLAPPPAPAVAPPRAPAVAAPQSTPPAHAPPPPAPRPAPSSHTKGSILFTNPG